MASAFPMLSPPALPPAENLDLTREGSPLQVPRSRSLTALPLRSPPLGPGRRAAFEYPDRGGSGRGAQDRTPDGHRGPADAHRGSSAGQLFPGARGHRALGSRSAPVPLRLLGSGWHLNTIARPG